MGSRKTQREDTATRRARCGVADGARLALVLAVWLCAGAALASGCSEHRPRVVAGAGCADNADCGDGERCDWPATDACGATGATGATGACVAYRAALCPELGFWVCGCDGVTYTNACHSDASGVAVAYGGPCRAAGSYHACRQSADCPADAEFAQYCIDDPRDGCVPGGATACPGVCVHATYVCSAQQACLSASSLSETSSPGTEACAAVTECADGSCAAGRCVYTTRVACTAQADCNAGELCVPALGCSGAGCAGMCVRP